MSDLYGSDAYSPVEIARRRLVGEAARGGLAPPPSPCSMGAR